MDLEKLPADTSADRVARLENHAAWLVKHTEALGHAVTSLEERLRAMERQTEELESLATLMRTLAADLQAMVKWHRSWRNVFLVFLSATAILVGLKLLTE